MNPPRSPKRIYLDSAKPDDFVDIQIHDWIEGVGDVSTHYEEQFFRSYGKLLVSRMTPARQPQQEYIITMGRIIKARNMLMVDGYHNADVLDRVVNLLRARPHTPAPEPDQKAPICENCGLDNTTCRMDMAVCLQAQNAAAKAAREQVLLELGTMLNSRIAKMEKIICSKSKTPLREGILMAYREIEGWEMQQCKSLRAQQPKEPQQRLTPTGSYIASQPQP